MLVAHMDTVHKESPKNVWFSPNYNKIKSDEGIGGDDRCGIFIIMNILKKTKLRPNILFVEDEEIGGIGSNKFLNHYNKDNLDLDYIIEIDRKGSKDSVYYDLDNLDFENYINKFGFETDWGSFTDICHLCPHFEIAGVNLSSGYYNPHTTNEYVVVSEMLATRNKVINILKTYRKKGFRNKFEWKEIVYNTYYYKNYNSDYYYTKNWVYYYNKNNKTNPYYRDPDTVDFDTKDTAVEDKVHYKGTCSYCGKSNVLGRDDEQGYFCCDDCSRMYGLCVCAECGCYSYDTLCDSCQYMCDWNNIRENDDD